MSKAGFLLVTNGQYCDGTSIDAIPNHIAAVSKVDQPFPTLIGEVFNKMAHIGV